MNKKSPWQEHLKCGHSMKQGKLQTRAFSFILETPLFNSHWLIHCLVLFLETEPQARGMLSKQLPLSHILSPSIQFPQLSSSSRHRTSWLSHLSLPRTDSVFLLVFAMASCVKKRQPEHHVSLVRLALGSDKARKSDIFSMILAEVL